MATVQTGLTVFSEVILFIVVIWSWMGYYYSLSKQTASLFNVLDEILVLATSSTIAFTILLVGLFLLSNKQTNILINVVIFIISIIMIVTSSIILSKIKFDKLNMTMEEKYVFGCSILSLTLGVILLVISFYGLISENLKDMKREKINPSILSESAKSELKNLIRDILLENTQDTIHHQLTGLIPAHHHHTSRDVGLTDERPIGDMNLTAVPTKKIHGDIKVGSVPSKKLHVEIRPKCANEGLDTDAKKSNLVKKLSSRVKSSGISIN